MPLGCHSITDVYVSDELPDLDYVTRELVANDEGWFAATLRPIIPFVNVDVRSTHARPANPDEDLVVEDRRNRHVGQLETGTGMMLDEGLHRAGRGQRTTDRSAREKTRRAPCW
jgi:hypothetical protein